MLWLMVLIVLGTLAQRDLGLYQSQQLYYSTWITWIGYIPTPGGWLCITVIFINILFFILKPNLWSYKKIGLLILHFGILILLGGAGLTAWFSEEGSLVIDEGKTSNFFVDINDRELAIINTSDSLYNSVTTFNQKLFNKKSILQHSSLPFTIEILEYYLNCEPLQRRTRSETEYHGFSKNFSLMPIANEKEMGLNKSGITIKINGINQNVDGIYSFIMGIAAEKYSIKINDEEYIITLRMKRRYLPFQFELLDFKKILYPGTTLPKSFSSDLKLIDNNIKQSILIQMNEPLRYRGYTFYQASYNESINGDTSILAVVKNSGWIFPYLASIVSSIGLLIHILIQMPKLFKTRNNI